MTWRQELKQNSEKMVVIGPFPWLDIQDYFPVEKPFTEDYVIPYQLFIKKMSFTLVYRPI